MKKHLLMMVAASALFASCKKDDDAQPNNNNNNGNNNNNNTSTIKTGTKFTYRRTDFDDQTGTTVKQTADYTLTMIRDTTINDQKWFVMQHSSGQLGLARFASDGMYTMSASGERMRFKVGAVVGDKWTDQNDQENEVKSINQSVSVPKGSFTNATYVEARDANSLENKFWYNDKEWLLKNEEYDESPTTPGQMIVDYRDELVEVTY